MNSKKKPNIAPTPNGPYVIKDLKNFANQKGPIATNETIALCRCGGSANKPFCDGTHKERLRFSMNMPSPFLALVNRKSSADMLSEPLFHKQSSLDATFAL